MKKVVFLAMLVVVLVALFAQATIVLAQDNFSKDGQRVLAKSEQMLLEKKVGIDDFISWAVEDRVVTGDEMIALNRMVDNFSWAKSEADGDLKFYKLSTETILDEKMVGAVKDYYNMPALSRHDDRGTAKAYFVELIGEDVVVGSYFMIDIGQMFLIFFGVELFFLFVVCILALLLKRDHSSIIGAIIFGSVFFLVMLALFL